MAAIAVGINFVLLGAAISMVILAGGYVNWLSKQPVRRG